MFQGVDIDRVHKAAHSNNQRGRNQWGDPQVRIDRCTELLAEPMTTAELITASGYCESAIKRYIALLHEAKRIHICAYRGAAIVYQVGNKPDVQKAKPQKALPKKRTTDMDDWPRPPVQVTIARDQLVAAFFGNGKQRGAA